MRSYSFSVGILAIALLFAGPLDAAKSHSKHKKSKKVTVTEPKVAPRAPMSAPPAEIVPIVPAPTVPGMTTSLYKREIQSGMGMFLLDRPGFALHTEIHFLLNPKRPLYVGGDMTFSLTSAGYYFGLFPGVWYDFILQETPLAHLTVGFLLGPAFCRGMAGIADVTFATFGEASISFELDDLTTVRGQFRPGIVGGRLAFGMNVLIGFRFR